MKTFKQFLAEDMPILQDYGRAPGYDYSKKIQVPRHIGRIGPYTVWHHEVHPESDSEAVSVHHGNKQIGVVPFQRVGKYRGKETIQPDNPSFDREHRGKKAKVRNLVPKVYSLMADNIAQMESGDYQTHGSRSVWKRLSKMRPVNVRGSYYGSRSHDVTTYGHEDHPNFTMDSPDYSDYKRRHEYATRISKKPRLSNLDKGNLDAALSRMTGALRVGGMNTRRMTSLQHLPHPRQFKKNSLQINTSGRYNPEKHDALVYNPEEGDMFTLILPSRGKQRKKK